MKFPFWPGFGAQSGTESASIQNSETEGGPKETHLSSLEAFDQYHRNILKQFMQLQAVEAHHSAKTGLSTGNYPMSEAWGRVQQGLQFGADPFNMAIMAHQQQIRNMRQMQMASRASAQGGVGSLAGNVESLAVHQ